MTATISLALVLHNHQPVGNFGWVIEDVYRRAYEPMIGALERHPGVRLALHYTGPLLEWLRAHQPELIERISVLVRRGQVEILGGAYHEPILASLPERDRVGQLLRMGAELEDLFGERPRGAWLAERVWEPSLPHDLARGRYAWTVLDDNHLRAASVPEDRMWGAYRTDDQGQALTIFGTEQGLRYRIPFGEVDELIGYLRMHATEDGMRVGMMGDDGEKFGAWPDTFEHCWGGTRWVDRCFEALEANADWLRTVTPSRWLEHAPPEGRIYVPTSSYVEMTQWALPHDEANAFHDALAAARAADSPAARFLRGGFWRNFRARYREINDLQAQMLRASEAVDRMPPGDERDLATDHLYRGQSNDCYWHGLFGGIYIVHMRMATLAHLIAAQDLADEVLGSVSSARHADLDLDGRHEALLTASGQSVLVHLAEGAGIGSWDLRASRVALASVMRRRPEAYHGILLEHDRHARQQAEREAAGSSEARGADEQPHSIHDIVKVKEPDLSDRLVYDRHERRGALVHLLPPSTTLGVEELSRAAYPEWGDFVDQPWELVSLSEDRLETRRDGHLARPDGRHALRIEKCFSVGGGRLDPALAVELHVEDTGFSAIRAELGLEFSFDLMGGGGNPAAYYETSPPSGGPAATSQHDGSGDVLRADRLAFGNRDVGVRIELRLDHPARLSWFPVETISNSEAGFERAYQGSCLMIRWPLALEPGDRSRHAVRFTVRQTTDLREEERTR